MQLADEYPGLAPFLVGLLRALDDEKLAVLHRESGPGFWVAASGVADNFQLHTLLAGVLLAPGKDGAGYLPGPRPTAAMIAAADGTGDLMPPGGITGQFTWLTRLGSGSGMRPGPVASPS